MFIISYKDQITDAQNMYFKNACFLRYAMVRK